MTRKHFIALAKALKETKPMEDITLLQDTLLLQWQTDVIAITEVLSMSNDRFDADRFLKACNYKLNGV